MQKKKDEVKKLIMEAAKTEFLSKGFSNASLRGIAKRAGVTKGNIYTYFKNKDDLFLEIIAPVWSYIEDSMSREVHDVYLDIYTGEKKFLIEPVMEQFKDYVRIIFRYSDELKLLFTASAGSSIEDFKERIFKLYSESSRKFFRTLSGIDPGYQWEFSEMFIHSLASLYLRFLEEVIMHEPGQKELDKFTEEISMFVTCGTLAFKNKKRKDM